MINMAAVASSYKLFFTDNTILIAKGCNGRGKRELLLYDATTYDHVKLEANLVLRKHASPHKRRLYVAIKALSGSEKHLKSLDSYLGKLHCDSKQPYSQTLDKRTESTGTSYRLKRENCLRLLEDYLGKLEDTGTENYVSKHIETMNDISDMKDQGSGMVRPSYNYMELKTEDVDANQQSVDTTSAFYLIGALASMDIAVFLFEIASPVKDSNLELFSLPSIYGAKINNLILTGEWWRLVTPIFLHSGIFHIALGIWVLFTFGIEVSQIYGSFTFLCIYVLGGISGNLISFLHTPEPTVGGTGPVFAIIGAWLIYQVQNKGVIAKDASEIMFRKAIIATALSFIISNFGSIDNWSHFAATFTGIAYGFVTCPTIQVKNTSPKAVRSGSERITLVRRYTDPCRSLMYFSVFLLLLSSLLFVIEPPLDLIE